jgi:hypothetical protein
MSDYRVTVTVPVELATVASAVGRAMDIDVGGADSFVERDGQLVAQTWASAEFATMFEYLIASPAGLYQAVAADYATRWPELQAPDLPAIEAFCEAATMTIDPPLQ